MGHILEDRWLRAALLAAMDAAPLVDYRPGRAGRPARRWSPGGVEVVLADGERLGGRLVVACDGRDSAVARRAGIGRRGWEYRQTSLVAAVEHARPHRGIAHQFFMPAGPLAILPLPGDRSSIVWTEERARAAAIAALDEADYLAALRPRFGDFLGPLRLAGARYAYPIGLSLAERLTGERLALVGDAAHGIHPLAGQGLNLGLRDVATLAEVLTAAARRGEDLGAAGRAGALCRAGGGSTSRARRDDGRDQPAVLQRQSAAAARARPRPRPGRPAAGAAPGADRRGGGPRRRPAAPAARAAALSGRGRWKIPWTAAPPCPSHGRQTAPRPPSARVAQG